MKKTPLMKKYAAVMLAAVMAAATVTGCGEAGGTETTTAAETTAAAETTTPAETTAAAETTTAAETEPVTTAALRGELGEIVEEGFEMAADEGFYNDVVSAIEDWCLDNDEDFYELDLDEVIEGDDGIIWEE